MAHRKGTGAPRTRRVRGNGHLRTGSHQSHWNTRLPYVPVERERAGRGYRHVIRRRDMRRFVELIPRWKRLQRGLRRIVLAGGDVDYLGLYQYVGVIEICAWTLGGDVHFDGQFVDEHRRVFERIGVDVCKSEDDEDDFLCTFNRVQARAFLLMHVFLHELGHHHDRMTTRSKQECARGEPYAEAYANELAGQIWEDYERTFGLN